MRVFRIRPLKSRLAEADEWEPKLKEDRPFGRLSGVSNVARVFADLIVLSSFVALLFHFERILLSFFSLNSSVSPVLKHGLRSFGF